MELRAAGPASIYCFDGPVAKAYVDHFIPWSRWPNDAIENLVLAHATCNGHKSDRVPGPRPLGRWVARLQVHADGLRSAASASNWESHRGRTLALARTLYVHLPDGAPVWNGTNEIVPARPNELASMLSTVSE